MHQFFKLLFITFLLCNFIYISYAYPATINANSCSQSDVQAAIDSASAGDTVLIPDGSCTWTSSGFGYAITIYKPITLKGNGMYSVNENHEDTGYWPLTITLSGTDNIGIGITGSVGDKIRITGIHFTGSCLGGNSGGGAIITTSFNETGNWRVDNCKFTLDRGNFMTSRTSGLGGLIDHIYSYTGGCNSSNALRATDQRMDSRGNWALSQTVGFGTASFTFLEDSTFWHDCTDITSSPAVADAQAGGKYVFRYNYVRNGFIVTHGSESGCPQRGGYAFEVYNNEFECVGSGQLSVAIAMRGGTWLVHHNTVTNFQNLITTNVYRASNSYCIFYQCDGSQVHDGNWGNPYPPGYPCLDQPGRGKANGPTLSEVQPQEESKIHIWSNTRNYTNLIQNKKPDYVVEGRDYEASDDDGAEPVGYAPYQYPHPLTTNNDPDAPPPPTNLQIVQ